MMAKFMRDNVGLRELRIAAAEASQLIPEAEVDVDHLVRRAIERAGLRLGGAAAGIGVVVIEHKLGVAIVSSGLLGQKRCPRLLHIIKRPGDEFRRQIFTGLARVRAVPGAAMGCDAWEGTVPPPAR